MTDAGIQQRLERLEEAIAAMREQYRIIDEARDRYKTALYEIATSRRKMTGHRWCIYRAKRELSEYWQSVADGKRGELTGGEDK